MNSMAERPKAKDLVEFHMINDEYQVRMRETHEILGHSWLVYMEQHMDPIAKRWRVILGTIIDLIPKWREMADNAEVVLGSGNMIDHEPFYRIINSVNWPNPDATSFAVVTRELTGLMTRISHLIKDDANRSAEDAAAMDLELIHHGIIPNGSEKGEASTSQQSKKLALEPTSEERVLDDNEVELQYEIDNIESSGEELQKEIDNIEPRGEELQKEIDNIESNLRDPARSDEDE